jgi:hypothetical protein
MKKLPHHAPQQSEIEAEKQTSKFIGEVVQILVSCVPYALVKNWNKHLDDLVELKIRLLKALDPNWKMEYQKKCSHYDGDYWSAFYATFFGKREIHEFNVQQISHRIPKGKEYQLFCIPDFSVNLESLIRIVHKHFFKHCVNCLIRTNNDVINPSNEDAKICKGLLGDNKNPYGYILLNNQPDDKQIEKILDSNESHEFGLTVYMALLLCLHLRYRNINTQEFYVCGGDRFYYENNLYIPVVKYVFDAVVIDCCTTEVIQGYKEQCTFITWENITHPRS